MSEYSPHPDFETIFPDGYAVEGNRLGKYYLKSKGNAEPEYEWSELCNFVPWVTSTARTGSADDSANMITVEGIDYEGRLLPEIVLTMDEFMKMNWPELKWSPNCVFTPGRGTRDAVRYAVQSTATLAEEKQIYLSTGFCKTEDGKYVFIMPDDPERNVKQRDVFNNYGFLRSDDTKYLQHIKTFLKLGPPRITYPLLAYLVLSPFVTFLGEAGHFPKTGLTLIGHTGCFKSSLARAALCFFGSFDEKLPLHLSDTYNSVIDNLYFLKDLPTVYDDLHPGTEGEKRTDTENFSKCVRALGNREGRRRLDSSLSQKAERYPRGNVITTAETLGNISESVKARILQIEMHYGDIDAKLLQEMQTAGSNGELSACMYQFTNWIAEKYLCSEEAHEKFINDLKRGTETFRDWFPAQLTDDKTKIRPRLADDLATLRVGFVYLLAFLQDKNAISYEERNSMLQTFDGAMKELAMMNSEATNTAKPTTVFISKLNALIESGVCTVKKFPASAEDTPSLECVGYRKENEFLFFPSKAHKAVRKLCNEQGEPFITNEADLLKMLKDENISSCNKGRNLKKVRPNSGGLSSLPDEYYQSKSYLCIPCGLFYEIARGNEAEDEDDKNLSGQENEINEEEKLPFDEE